MELMAVDGAVEPYEEPEEFMCMCRGRGRFRRLGRKTPRLPLKAMLIRMSLSDDDYGRGKSGRGRARMLQEHCAIAVRKPGTYRAKPEPVKAPVTADLSVNASHSVTQYNRTEFPSVNTSHSVTQYNRTEFPSLAESMSGDTSESNTGNQSAPVFKKPKGVGVKQKKTFRKLTDFEQDITSKSSDIDMEYFGTRSEHSEYSGLDSSNTSDQNSRHSFDIEKPVRRKTKANSFDLAKANQSLLNQLPLMNQKQKIMSLTIRNLEKFNKESDKESSASYLGPRANEQELENLPLYERFAVTHDDIRRSHCQSPMDQAMNKHHNNLIEAIDKYLNGSDNIAEQRVGNPVISVNECNNRKNSDAVNGSAKITNKVSGDINSELLDIADETCNVAVAMLDSLSNVSNLSNFTNPDLSDNEIYFSDEGDNFENTGAENENETVGNCINNQVHQSQSNHAFDQIKAAMQKEYVMNISGADIGETEQQSTGESRSTNISYHDAGLLDNIDSDVPVESKEINNICSQTKVSHEKKVQVKAEIPELNDGVINTAVVVVGDEAGSSDMEGFEKVVSKHAKKKTPPKQDKSRQLCSKYQDNTVWRLYGREVIQVDGLPGNLDIDHLLNMVNAFGMVKDYQVRQAESGSSVRFKLDSADSCEFATQCLHDSECVLPESSGKIICEHLQ